MNIVSELLLGSSVIDVRRKEISTVINMILGFLDEDDYTVFDLSGATVLDESNYYRWTATIGDGNRLSFRLYRINEFDKKTELACTLPGERISLEHIDFVYWHLDALVRSLEKLVPALSKRWSKLLKVAKDEFSIYYEICFRIPAPDSEFVEERENGKEVKFRKKSDLKFPLPMNTEVFVRLEGKATEFRESPISSGTVIPVNDDGDCFFRVVGHESSVLDHYGDLTEEGLSIVLEPQEGWEGNPYSEHFMHLMPSNGWERCY